MNYIKEQNMTTFSLRVPEVQSKESRRTRKNPDLHYPYAIARKPQTRRIHAQWKKIDIPRDRWKLSMALFLLTSEITPRHP